MKRLYFEFPIYFILGHKEITFLLCLVNMAIWRDCRKYAIGFVAGVSSSVFLLLYCKIEILSNPASIQQFKHVPRLESYKFKIVEHKKYSCNETFEKTKNPDALHIPARSTFYVEACSNPTEDITTTLILSHPVTEKLAFINVTKISLLKFARVILVAYESDIALIRNTDWFSQWFEKRFFTVSVDLVGSYGEAMNRAIDLVPTPLVVIAPRIAYINFDIVGQKLDVQRLIRMLETLHEAEVVGGAIKDVRTGHWTRGCYQTRDLMYTLKFTDGYRHSYHECLFCDHISSPFLARTSFMKKMKFPEDDHGLFIDFFFRVKRSKKITLSCPDVMFYVSPIPESEDDLQNFGERWNIGQIIDVNVRRKKLLYFHDGPDKRHDQKSIAKHCHSENRGKIGKSLARHPGCRYNLVKFIQYVCKTLSGAGISYVIDEGTLLGAVKFDYVLPWEMDADITVFSPYSHVVERAVPRWRENGVRIEDHGAVKKVPFWRESGARIVDHSAIAHSIDLWLYGWKCELYIYDTYFSLTQYPGLQTRVNIGGQWVYTLENPGFHMRVRYGQEIFRHVEHYSYLGTNTGWAPYDAGKFTKCTKPGHQGCLDQFEADGNIQFLDIM